METKVSVIIPVYNVSKYLRRCIKTVINQTMKEIEIILVNDGSTDDSGSICEEYAKNDKRISVVNKENEGLGYARNTGLKYAKSPYILFIDSDDYIELDMIKEMYNNIIQNESDICYCDFNRVNGKKVIPCKHIKGKEGAYSDKQITEDIIPDLIGGAPTDRFDDIIGWGVWKVLYKREIIINNHILFHSEKEMISEDIIFQLDYLKHVKKATIIDKAFYNYCINNGSLSTTYRKDRFEKNIYLYEEILKRTKELESYEKCRLRADRLLISSIRMECMINARTLNYKDAMANIKKIVNNSTIEGITKEYPINQLPIKQRMFAHYLKTKRIHLIYFTTKLYTAIKY